MLYLENDYNNYKYLVEASDNYVILSSRSHISGSSGDSDTIPVIIKYLQPSFITLESTYSSFDSTTFTDISSTFSDNVYDRADFPLIFFCGFTILLVFTFILNQLTKLVYKGGLFGSN